MHDDRQLVEHRIRRETFQRVLPAMYRAAQPFTVEAWDVPGEPVSFAAAMEALAAGAFRPFTIGDHWSRPWGTTWFRVTGSVPDGWGGEGTRRPQGIAVSRPPRAHHE